jgi:hypothetical protein
VRLFHGDVIMTIPTIPVWIVNPTQSQQQQEQQRQRQQEQQQQQQRQREQQQQDQSEYQNQNQGQWQFSLSDNKNDNKNDNKSVNANLNGNLNANLNLNANKNVNVNETKVDVDVDVDLKVDGEIKPGVFDIDFDEEVIDNEFDDLKDQAQLFQNIDITNQNLPGEGNDQAFALDQINNMQDADYLGSSTVSSGVISAGSDPRGPMYPAAADAAPAPDIDANVVLGGVGFQQIANIGPGGSATANDATGRVGDDGNVEGVGSASADISVTQNAFSPNIVMGANIQFNQLDITAVGGDDPSGDPGGHM